MFIKRLKCYLYFFEVAVFHKHSHSFDWYVILNDTSSCAILMHIESLWMHGVESWFYGNLILGRLEISSAGPLKFLSPFKVLLKTYTGTIPRSIVDYFFAGGSTIDEIFEGCTQRMGYWFCKCDPKYLMIL